MPSRVFVEKNAEFAKISEESLELIVSERIIFEISLLDFF